MAGTERKQASTKAAKQICENRGAKPDKGNPPPGRRLPQSIHVQLYKNQVVSCGDAPSQGRRRWICILLVFVVLAVCLGSPPGVRLFLPLYPTRSMSAAILSLPSILLLRLVP